MSDSVVDRFNCPSRDLRETEQALREYFRLVRASMGGAAATSSYSYLQWQFSSFYCDASHWVRIDLQAPRQEDVVMEAFGEYFDVPAGTT